MKEEWQCHNDTSKKKYDIWTLFFFNKSAVSRKKIGEILIFARRVYNI